jgi:tetratricopeptide (TPR) repeat protein
MKKNVLITYLMAFINVLIAQPCDSLFQQAKDAETYQETITILTKIIEIHCDSVEQTLNNRGYMYLQLEDYKAALADFNQAHELAKKNTAILTNRATTYNRLKEYDKAFVDIRQAIQLEPQKSEHWVILGGIWGTKGDFNKGIACFDTALMMDKMNFQALYDKGRMHRAMDSLEAALLDATLLTTRFPKSVRAWQQKAQISQQNSQLQITIDAYTQLIEIDPDNAYKHYVNRALIHQENGNSEPFLKDLNQSNRIKPNSLAYYNLGRYYLKAGKYDEAIAENTKAIDLNPNYSDAYLNRGNAYFKSERYDKAIENYEAGLKTNPYPNTKGKLRHQLEAAQALQKK